jgi:toxin CcdB
MQFGVYRLERPRRPDVAYVVDVQSDLVDTRRSRVVVPLVDAVAFGRPAARLNPLVEVEGRQCVFAAAEIAALPVRELGARVTSLAERRDELLAALDLLIFGF